MGLACSYLACDTGSPADAAVIHRGASGIVLDVAVVGNALPVQTEGDARLGTPSSPAPAPRDTHDAFVTVAPKEPSQAPDIMPLTRQTTAPVALPPHPISRTDGALQRVPSTPSAEAVSGTVTRPEAKARQLTPVPSRPIHYGSVSVESQPTGAEVSVDGQLVGVTPLVGWQLPARSHVVRIDLEGYDRWSASIRVVADKTASVVANLQPIRQH